MTKPIADAAEADEVRKVDEQGEGDDVPSNDEEEVEEVEEEDDGECDLEDEDLDTEVCARCGCCALTMLAAGSGVYQPKDPPHPRLQQFQVADVSVAAQEPSQGHRASGNDDILD